MMADKWQNRAACAGADPKIFDTSSRVAEAQQFCAWCPVFTQCDTAGKVVNAGTWAGRIRDRKSAPSLTIPYLEEHGTDAGYTRHMKAGTPPCDRCTIAHNFTRTEREHQVSA